MTTFLSLPIDCMNEIISYLKFKPIIKLMSSCYLLYNNLKIKHIAININD